MSFFFLLYLQDHGLLRTRNFLPRQRHVTTTLHPLRIHSPAASVFLCLRKEREQLIEELFGNQDRYNLLTCNDTNPSGSQKKSISVISSQGQADWSDVIGINNRSLQADQCYIAIIVAAVMVVVGMNQDSIRGNQLFPAGLCSIGEDLSETNLDLVH